MFKKSLHPLLPKKYDFGKRRNTFRKTLKLLEERRAKILVETGTARNGLNNTKSDGASTIVFGSWAKQNDANLYSIDYDLEAIAWAQKEVLRLELKEYVEFINSDSIAFLFNFQQTVDFLYLDSFDYDRRDKTQQRLSQEHHLKEFQAIEKQLHSKSLVLIDDCKLPGGGKGKLVIDYMRTKGWKLDMSAYQCLLLPSNAK